jgi:hypothetical protein
MHGHLQQYTHAAPVRWNQLRLVLTQFCVAGQKKLRTTHAKFLAGIGLFAGFMIASQSSFGRLMGYRKNTREVQLYGVYEQKK